MHSACSNQAGGCTLWGLTDATSEKTKNCGRYHNWFVFPASSLLTLSRRIKGACHACYIVANDIQLDHYDVKSKLRGKMTCRGQWSLEIVWYIDYLRWIESSIVTLCPLPRESVHWHVGLCRVAKLITMISSEDFSKNESSAEVGRQRKWHTWSTNPGGDWLCAALLNQEVSQRSPRLSARIEYNQNHHRLIATRLQMKARIVPTRVVIICD